MNEDEIGRKCNMHEEKRNACMLSEGKLEERVY
jgi:hypothetical protein